MPRIRTAQEARAFVDQLFSNPAAGTVTNGVVNNPEQGGNWQWQGLNKDQIYQNLVSELERQGQNTDYNPNGGINLSDADASTAWRPGVQTDNMGLIRALGGAAAMYFGGPLLAGQTGAAGGSMLAEDAAGNIYATSGPSAFSSGGLAGGTAAGAALDAGTAAGAAGASGAASGGGLLSSVGSALSGVPGLAQLAGAALGAAAGRDSTTTASNTKDPWAPAQPYLLENLKQNQAMSDYYTANPFSNEQKMAYQNLANTLANANGNVPGLLSNANAFGRSNRGQMPAMTSLLSNIPGPVIDFSQYANIGRK